MLSPRINPLVVYEDGLLQVRQLKGELQEANAKIAELQEAVKGTTHRTLRDSSDSILSCCAAAGSGAPAAASGGSSAELEEALARVAELQAANDRLKKALANFTT